MVFAEASGLPKEVIKDTIYASKMPSKENETTEPFGWFCHMTIVRLPEEIGGCLIYSPVLGKDQSIQPVITELTERLCIGVV